MAAKFSLKTLTKKTSTALKTQFHIQICQLSSVNNTLLSVFQAHQVIDKSLRSNHLLFEYSRDNKNREVVNLFVGIHRSSMLIDGSTLSCVLKACALLCDRIIGVQVHDYCVKSGYFNDVSVGTALVDMYMKNECVEEGKRVFYDMAERNVVSWTSLLAGYAQNGLNLEAFGVFLGMQAEGIRPNPFTFATVLGALAQEGMCENGVQVHAMAIKNGRQKMTSVCNSLINMYSKSGMVRDAGAVFDSMVNRDAITWNSMVACYVTNGCYSEAFELFYRMILAGVGLTKLIFASVIKLCANTKELSLARQLHCQILKSGYEYDWNIRTAMMVAYNKCREMDDALKIFSLLDDIRNVISWTAMISGFLQNGKVEQAVNLFCQMNCEGVIPNDFTYSTILAAHPVVSIFEVHAQAIKTDYVKSPAVGTALLDVYVKLGNVDEATQVFQRIGAKDIVAWSAMISGYAQFGDTEGAVKTFAQMLDAGNMPNEYTLCSVINACAAPTASVEQGKQFHAWSIKLRFNNALCVSSALVTMYAKRGDIDRANKVFRRQTERDLVSWNSMISGYGQHGHARKALELFEDMQRQQMEVDDVTFVGIISACTHAGLVDKGQRYYDLMVKELQIEPRMEHYSCMVDLYSRAGMFDEAMDIINEMTYPAGATIWRTLLAASRVYRNLELGKLAAEKLISLQPHDSAAYVLLSNMYASSGKWKERSKVRRLMDKRKVKKETGFSWIEVKNKTYSFLAGDVSHPMSDQIYLKLEDLSYRLKDAGYQPDTSYVLQDVDEEHKEAILSRHSERLAIAFGLIATPAGTPLQIVKNLRVCGDCHTVIKLISNIERREIVVRDSNRFHHFQDGSCSCGDYW